jgi:hypothetical protein
MAQYFLDRPLITDSGAYGERLRAGLNNGAAFGGSEVDLPAEFERRFGSVRV